MRLPGKSQCCFQRSTSAHNVTEAQTWSCLWLETPARPHILVASMGWWHPPRMYFWVRLAEVEQQQTSHWHWLYAANFGDVFGNLHECWTDYRFCVSHKDICVGIKRPTHMMSIVYHYVWRRECCSFHATANEFCMTTKKNLSLVRYFLQGIMMPVVFHKPVSLKILPSRRPENRGSLWGMIYTWSNQENTKKISKNICNQEALVKLRKHKRALNIRTVWHVLFHQWPFIR